MDGQTGTRSSLPFLAVLAAFTVGQALALELAGVWHVYSALLLWVTIFGFGAMVLVWGVRSWRAARYAWRAAGQSLPH